LLAFTAREDNEAEKTAARNVLRAVTETDSDVRVRQMDDADLERILELRSIVRWSADPRAFDLLRGVRDARWAVAEAPDGDLASMVGAVERSRCVWSSSERRRLAGGQVRPPGSPDA
jgi:hypothetical protein